MYFCKGIYDTFDLLFVQRIKDLEIKMNNNHKNQSIQHLQVGEAIWKVLFWLTGTKKKVDLKRNLCNVKKKQDVCATSIYKEIRIDDEPIISFKYLIWIKSGENIVSMKH